MDHPSWVMRRSSRRPSAGRGGRHRKPRTPPPTGAAGREFADESPSAEEPRGTRQVTNDRPTTQERRSAPAESQQPDQAEHRPDQSQDPGPCCQWTDVIHDDRRSCAVGAGASLAGYRMGSSLRSSTGQRSRGCWCQCGRGEKADAEQTTLNWASSAAEAFACRSTRRRRWHWFVEVTFPIQACPVAVQSQFTSPGSRGDRMMPIDKQNCTYA